MNFGELLSTQWPSLLDGLGVTVVTTLAGCLLTLIISFALGLMAFSRHILTRGVARVIIEFFRGTSLVVQLVWFVFAMPLLLGVRFDSKITIGIVVLALNYGAYGSEVVRGGLTAVPQAQWEACTALNFSHWQQLTRVAIPQAWPEMIPSFSNLGIQVLKGSSLVSLIALVDLTLAAQQLRSYTTPGNVMAIFAMLLVVYFIMSYLIATLMRFLERKAKAGIGQGTPPKASVFTQSQVDLDASGVAI